MLGQSRRTRARIFWCSTRTRSTTSRTRGRSRPSIYAAPWSTARRFACPGPSDSAATGTRSGGARRRPTATSGPWLPAKASCLLDSIRLRREIERVESERRHEERIPSPLTPRDALGHADQIDVSGREHQHDALIEAEVADGIF